MQPRVRSKSVSLSAVVLVGLVVTLLPLHAADPVHITLRPDKQPEFTPDIVNGLLTADYPSVGVILAGPARDDNYDFCSGTLIGCNTFLTAAHCLCANMAFCDDHDVSTGWVYFPNGGVYGISAVDIYPNFALPDGDVAVVTLSEPVTGITPTPINDIAPVAFGTQGTIVGFGGDAVSFPGEGVKRYGTVTTQPCVDAYGVRITDEASVCWYYMEPVGAPGDDSSTCFGDSGGPLLVDMAEPGASEPNIVVAGITTGSFTACQVNDQAFDANVYTYREFIESVAGDDLGTGSCGDLPPVGSPETLVLQANGKLDVFQTEALHEFVVPPDIDLLRITMNATALDFQNFWMFVRHGTPPTDTDIFIDCAHTGPGNHAICEFENPMPGTWYAAVRSMQGESGYQVTATAFGNVPDAGVVDISVDPSVAVVSPGGLLRYTLGVRNRTDEARVVPIAWRFIKPSGTELRFGPFEIPVAPQEDWSRFTRIGVGEESELGYWTMIVETTHDDGSIDRGWTRFLVQDEHAVSIDLSSSEAAVHPGEDWHYKARIENLTGKPLDYSLVCRVRHPDGHEQVFGPFRKFLHSGATWQDDLSLGRFTEDHLDGVWTLTFETTATGGIVDQDAMQFDLRTYGDATIRKFEDVASINGISPDGRVMIGNLDSRRKAYVWTADTGVVPLGEAAATDLSDDGSVILGTIAHPSGLGQAAIWTADQGWQDLGLVSEPNACGTHLTSPYDISADGRMAVGLAWIESDGSFCHACAFRWTADTGMTCLGELDESHGTRANAVSSDGSVVMGFDISSIGYRRAAIWTADTPGDPFSTYSERLVGSLYPVMPIDGPGELRAMTPDGRLAAGDTNLGLEPGVPAGFYWSEDRGLEGIEAPVRGWGLWANKMTPDGKVIIGVTGPYTSPVRLAFIWTAETGAVLLSDRLEELGADLSEWPRGLNWATGITADGRTIVGWTEVPGGEGAWIATLPDPAKKAASASAVSAADDGAESTDGSLHLRFAPND